MLAAAFRLAVPPRLARQCCAPAWQDATDDSVASSAETAAPAVGHGLSRPRLERLAQDDADELPESVIRPFFDATHLDAKWKAQVLAPRGVKSGIGSDVVTRASRERVIRGCAAGYGVRWSVCLAASERRH